MDTAIANANCIVPRKPGGDGSSVLRLTTPMTRKVQVEVTNLRNR